MSVGTEACYSIKGTVNPFSPYDAQELHRLYDSIRVALAERKCRTVEASGSIVASCTGSSGQSLVAVWVEAPAIGRGGIEASLGFSINANNAGEALEAFSVIARALEAAKPARFTVRISR